MSVIDIEFFDRASNQSKSFGFGPSKSLVAFLCGGAIYGVNRDSSENIEIAIADILTPEECEYVYPVDRTENFDDQNEINEDDVARSDVKDPSRLLDVFNKLAMFYTKPLFKLGSDVVPPLWQENNIRQTLWDYTYIMQIVTCLKICKQLAAEVKYSQRG